MSEPVITNVSIYKDIAKEAYETMLDAMDRDTTTTSDGSRLIKRFDSSRTSFKSAMIAVVFAGVWLDAITHLLIVQRYGKAKFKEYDRKPYESRLEILGIQNSNLLLRVKAFRDARRELVHEKAFLDKGTRVAQKEAAFAYELLRDLDEKLLGNTNEGLPTPEASR